MIRAVEIEDHGRPAALAGRRARAVRRWLVEHGVDERRIRLVAPLTVGPQDEVTMRVADDR